VAHVERADGLEVQRRESDVSDDARVMREAVLACGLRPGQRALERGREADIFTPAHPERIEHADRGVAEAAIGGGQDVEGHAGREGERVPEADLREGRGRPDRLAALGEHGRPETGLHGEVRLRKGVLLEKQVLERRLERLVGERLPRLALARAERLARPMPATPVPP
jgi:hypothetical protein